VKPGLDQAEVVILCCVIKPLVSWHNQTVGTVCRERCGGQGYLAANKLGNVILFSHAGMTAEGDNSVLMTKVTKETMSLQSKGKFLPPIISKPSGPITLPPTVSLSTLLYVFVEREKLLFRELHQHMESKISSGKPLFTVWMLEESDLIQAAARAIGDRLVLQSFLHTNEEFKKKHGENDSWKVLEKMLRLFALRRLELDIGFLLTSGIVSLEAGKELSESIRVLCRELAPQSLQLVKAFGIPHHLLNVPIAQDWVEYNKYDNQGELSNLSFMKE